MLAISRQQVEVLAVPLMRKLETPCLQYLQKTASDPARFVESEALRQDIRRCIEDSRHFDFKWDASIMEYVRICICHGTNHQALVANRKARPIMAHSDLNEAERLYLVEKVLSRS